MPGQRIDKPPQDRPENLVHEGKQKNDEEGQEDELRGKIREGQDIHGGVNALLREIRVNYERQGEKNHRQ